MSKAWLAPALFFALLVLAACEDPFGPSATPTPVATSTPAFTATPVLTATPSGTPTITPTGTPTSTPTNTPTVTPTEGAVRTPIGGAAGPELNDALAAMEKVSSYRYNIEMVVGPPEARYVLTGTGEFKAPASYHTSYHSLDFPTEMTTISGTNYVRVNNGPWTQGELPAKTYPMGPPPSPAALLGLLTYSLDASLVGDELLGNQQARHFVFILRPESLPGMVGPFQGLAGGDLWVDPATHRFLKMQMLVDPSSSPERNAAVITFTFSDYNAPVTITPPK